jgi:hypothetical protein
MARFCVGRDSYEQIDSMEEENELKSREYFQEDSSDEKLSFEDMTSRDGKTVYKYVLKRILTK